MKRIVSASAIALFATSVQAASEMPSVEEMWRIMQAQSAEIAELKKNAVQQEQQISTTIVRVEQNEQKVEATADVIEQQADSGMAKLAEWANKTTIGGYGEMHYNNLDNEADGREDKDEIDLHRFVLFFGHQFTDNVRFYSELEVEHSVSGGGKDGEVELEQAFLEWSYADNQAAKAGVFLVPVGILNETHEPDTFYGVERNNVEKNIIPTTWWEGGLAANGEIAPGLSYDVGLHSGLFLDPGAGEFKIRDGRQKVSKAKADDFAYTARLKYTGIQGLELAATVQVQEDLFQGEMHASGANDIGATLVEAHAVYNSGPFGLRALYAEWDIDNDIELIAAGADKQEGWYVEPSIKLTNNLGIFARYSEWDNQAGSSVDSEYEQIDIGLNYWLTETVVLKADYQNQDAPAGENEFDGFNLGVGWSF